MAKQPAFMFYTGDWLKDPQLRRCSAAARGIWMDLLCLMHEMPTRGVLRDETGAVWSIEDVVNSIGGCTAEMVGELIDKRVLKKSHRRGTLFCARMLREAVVSRRRARSGKQGGSKTPSKPLSKTQAKPQAKRGSSYSSSVSSSVSISGDENGVLRPDSWKREIQRAELGVSESLRSLYAAAVRAEVIGQSDHDRVMFAGAAAHALRKGDNPGALFRSIVASKHWRVISQADEDEGQRIWKGGEVV